jgi:choline dehydrogenase-like flavoprotein
VFLDSGDIAAGEPVEADVCIIGGGAAGIAVALGLAGSFRRIVIVEGGGLAAGDAPRRPPRVRPRGKAHADLGPDPSRQWFFGGNTNTWAGNCRPFDPPDMEERAWASEPGWPITREDLLPWYERAQSMLNLGDFGWYDVAATRSHLTHPTVETDPAVCTTRLMQVCPVPSMATLHHERLATESSLRILVRCEVIRLVRDGQGAVAAVEVAGADGRLMQVAAGTFVLAGGGVANARMLLDADLGNESDLVGRFFMDHWWFDVPLGDWGRDRDLALYAFDDHPGETVEGRRLWAQFSLSAELMARERVAGLSIWFVRRSVASASVVAAEMLALSALRRVPFDPLTDIRLLAEDAARMPRHLARRLRDARRPDAPHALTLMVQLEQLPDRENRLLLSPELDALGRRIPTLALRLTSAELAGHERALAILARELGLDAVRLTRQMRTKLGGRRYDFFWHHVGTTRMADDPERGVVDTDCRVHGVPNLFVAGSSVFPTEGTAPPTLTIVALALRLADHIRRSNV